MGLEVAAVGSLIEIDSELPEMPFAGFGVVFVFEILWLSMLNKSVFPEELFC